MNTLLDQNFLRIKELIHKTFHRVPLVTDTLLCLCHRVGKERLLTPLGPKIAKKKKGHPCSFLVFSSFFIVCLR